jgi:hypothetical protein
MMRRGLCDDASYRATVQGHRELLEAMLARAITLVEAQHQRRYDGLIEGFDEAESGELVASR